MPFSKVAVKHTSFSTRLNAEGLQPVGRSSEPNLMALLPPGSAERSCAISRLPGGSYRAIAPAWHSAFNQSSLTVHPVTILDGVVDWPSTSMLTYHRAAPDPY